MNELTIKALKNFSNSAQWEIIKGGYLMPMLNDIRDVTKPFKVGDEIIDAEYAYYAKGLTAIKMKEFIDTVDRMRDNMNSTSSEDFE